jgi:hypothetical protein
MIAYFTDNIVAYQIENVFREFVARLDILERLDFFSVDNVRWIDRVENRRVGAAYLLVIFFCRTTYRYFITRVQNIVRQETQMLCQENILDANKGVIVSLHITVECLQKLRMYSVKIAT